MGKVDFICASIDVEEYVNGYRDVEKFLGLCRECGVYGKTWGCPPFDKDATSDLLEYKYAYVFGTKLHVDESLYTVKRSYEENTVLTYELLGPLRLELDEKLLLLEKKVPNSRVFYPGTCRRCEKGSCARIKGKPCVKPHELRPSLEALGFDISKTMKDLLNVELKWSKDGMLAEYFVLVSAIFSKEPISKDDLAILDMQKG